MLYDFVNGQTSVVLRVKLRDSSVSTGAGLTGLTSASSGLVISTITDNEATATTYTVAASNVETIATLGTYAAPTASKCRFKEVDATNHPGLYELQFADARFAVSGAKALVISISGASNLAQCDVVIPLRAVNPYAASFGLSLAKTTNITGFNDIAATAIVSGGAITTSGGAVSTVTTVGTVNTLAADSVNASALAASAVTEIQAGLSTLDAAGVRTALGLASANLDTQLAALPTAAENFAAVLTTALTESYAADGAAPTLAQAIFLIQQRLTEFAISGTTITTKKLDGETTAATFTLDSATAPTSSTRAS